MVEPIISTGAAIVGAGAWFADKIFGPSAEAIGENLRAYLSGRVQIILSRAEQIANEVGVDPQPIKPGLLARLVMDASFSEDDTEITEWWANLFVSASRAGSNKHAVFSDMMAMIGPQEAEALRSFIALCGFENEWDWYDNTNDSLALSQFSTHHEIETIVGDLPIKNEEISNVFSELASFRFYWPIYTSDWYLPTLSDSGGYMGMGRQNLGSFNKMEAFQILEQIGILRRNRIQFHQINRSGWVDLFVLTPLGAGFFAACCGHEPAAGSRRSP